MHLVIDLANQVILPQMINESLDSWIYRISKRIKFVVSLSCRWRLDPIFVCDAGYTTEEVQQKWRIRREKELEKGLRKIPFNADMIVCEMLLKLKLNLVYDKRYNADDIIATMANFHPRSIILSRDMDYFRYDDGVLKNKVFYIGESKKIIELVYKDLNRTPLKTIRMYFPHFAKSHLDLIKFTLEGMYVRGTAYPSAEREKSKSLHLATRKYRQMLYTGVVNEIFPIWNNNQVEWIDDHVNPVHMAFPSKTNILVDDIEHVVGGFVNESHKLTAIIMACELIAAKNETSLSSELELYFDSL